MEIELNGLQILLIIAGCAVSWEIGRHIHQAPGLLWRALKWLGGLRFRTTPTHLIIDHNSPNVYPKLPSAQIDECGYCYQMITPNEAREHHRLHKVEEEMMYQEWMTETERYRIRKYKGRPNYEDSVAGYYEEGEDKDIMYVWRG